MSFILLLLYLLLGSFVVFILIAHIKAVKTWTLTLWVQIWLGVYYVLIPLLLIIIKMSSGYFPGKWPDITILHPTYTTFKTFLATTLFLLSFYTFLSIKFIKYEALLTTVKFGIYRNSVLNILILGALILGIFSLFYFVNSLGGFKSAFKLAPYLNSPYFVDEYSKKYSGTFTMFKRFIPLVIYSALMWRFYPTSKSRLLFGFIPLLIFIYYTFLERQRQFTLILFLVPIFGYMVESNKFITKKFLVFLGLTVLLFPTITFLNKAFVYDKDSYDVVTSWFDMQKYIKEFNFPQIALYLSQTAEYEKFWFTDFIDGIFGNYLPSSWRITESVNGLNSYLFLGIKDRSVPPGLIANSFYHLGYAGVLIWGAFFGIFINIFETMWRGILLNDKRFAYIYVFSFMTFFAYIRTGVLGFSLYRPFFVFLILILLLSFKFRGCKEEAKKNI